MGEVEARERINARVKSKGFKDLGQKYDNERQVFILNQFSSFQFCEDSSQRRSRLRDEVVTSDGVCF